MSKDIKYMILVIVLSTVLGFMASITYLQFKSFKNERIKEVESNNWQKLNLILQEINTNYVDTLNYKNLTDAAINGVLSALDPHSIYMQPEKLKNAEMELAGKFYGIGIQFNVPNDTIVVMDVIPNGPSAKVGLQRGDRIIKVDGKNIAGINFPRDSMIYYLKGDENTKVNIDVKRGNDIISYNIIRGKIPMHCVDVAYMVDDTTGYIKLSKFDVNTYKEVDSALNLLTQKGLKHLIFDIRDNSGGYLAQALLLSNMFLNKGAEIVYIQGNNRPKKVYNADGNGKYKNLGLSVLINENSASSSEIFAGAIQDNDRGVIVGRRSFGKGLVQEPIYFSDGSGIRLTVARFYTPSGRCIQKPYGDDYAYDVYKRYLDGEMFNRDSIKIDTSLQYNTVAGRKVYGGGGIIPDYFVPVDTTNVNKFLLACNKKGSVLRYCSYIFDKDKDELSKISTSNQLKYFFMKNNIDVSFLDYVKKYDNLVPTNKEWEMSKNFLVPQIEAIIGRYTKMGDVAFYRTILPYDEVFKTAYQHSDRVHVK